MLLTRLDTLVVDKFNKTDTNNPTIQAQFIDTGIHYGYVKP